MATAFAEDAIFSLFEKSNDNKSGSRLGISYVRAQKSHLEIFLDAESKKTLFLEQDVADEEAISGVVWDAGLLMIDYLIMMKDAQNINCRHTRLQKNKANEQVCDSFPSCMDLKSNRFVLDLGSGTGVVGISAFHILGQGTNVFFSDKSNAEHLALQNIEQSVDFSGYGRDVGEGHVKPDGAFNTNVSTNSTFIAYDWTSIFDPPLNLVSPYGDIDKAWDMVFCSDVLYDEAMHVPLMNLLKKIRCKKFVFSYKKRHHMHEKLFFQLLSSWCRLHVVEIEGEVPNATTTVEHPAELVPDEKRKIRLCNCTCAMTTAGGGLYIVEAVPK
jgi:predicted nicotinamide N-methyase